MPDPVRSLDRIKVASPCTADWDAMIGTDQVRFCEHCNLHVTDLSNMTRQNAMRLVARSRGRLCVRYIQRPNGGVLTKQIPEKLYRISRRVSRIAAGAFTATLSLTSATAQTRLESNPSTVHQVASVAEAAALELGASVSGVITDPNGAVVSGATLTLMNSQSHVAFTFTTGDDGAYRFSFLEAGVYSLVVEAPSFARTEISELSLTPTANKSENVIMAIPGVVAEVQVETNAIEGSRVLMGAVAVVVEPEEPLVKAAFKNDLDAVKDLVFASLDVSAWDNATNMSALAYAVENGNAEIVQVLLAAGANVNARNRNGQTALLHLRDSATVDLVRTLVVAGAEINASDESGDTPLMRAAAASSLDVIKELISDGANTDAKNNAGSTVLMNAAENEDPSIVALLIKAGADVKAKDAGEQTALTIAVRWGKATTVKALIEAHADVDVKDGDGKTALMYASTNEESQIAKILIDGDAKVNARDNEDGTALMFAAEEGNALTVKALLEAGAEINAKDKDGQTALMRAVDNNMLESLRVLLAAGADLTVKDNDGNTALGLARENDNEEIINLLKSRGAPE